TCPKAPLSAQRPAVQQRTPGSRSSVTRPRGAAGAARGVAAEDHLRAHACGVRLLQRPVMRLLGGLVADPELPISTYSIREVRLPAKSDWKFPLNHRVDNALRRGVGFEFLGRVPKIED